MRRIAWALAATLALTACDTWFGATKKNVLKGERVSVLAHERALKPVPDLAEAVRLPPPRRNAAWPQSGGQSGHAMHHLELSDTIRRAWTSSAGSGSDSRDRLMNGPVVADGRVFVMDTEARVTAFDAKNGDRQWSVSLIPEGKDSASLMAGGLAFDKGRVFASSGFGEVAALKADTGARIWRRTLGVPLRAAPTVSGERVFVVNKENELRALAAEDGRDLWTHSGVVETASLLGSPSPAVEAGVVVAAFSTGELIALKVENGSVVWSDTLTAIRRTDAMSNMSDIRGQPVIDRGRVYSVGHSGIMVAIDLRTGLRLWELEAGGTHQPWIGGDYLYLLTNDSELTAVEARSGRVVWVTPLQNWEDPSDKDNRILWTGPALASDRLIVAGSHGEALSISPYTGQILGREEMPAGVTIAPVISDGTLYFLTDDADLVAYR